MGLAAAYRTKFLKQELVKKNQIRRGMILLGKYKSAKSGEITNKVSLVLDWTPFRGNIAQRKLYVFDLDNLQPSLLKRLIKKVGGLEFTSYNDFTYHRVKFGEGIRDGSITFNKYIRDFISEVKGVWKTYTLKNYKEINLVDFDYGSIFNEKDLPPRVTVVDKLNDVEEKMGDVEQQLMNEELGEDSAKKLRVELDKLGVEKEKLLRRKAQGKLT